MQYPHPSNVSGRCCLLPAQPFYLSYKEKDKEEAGCLAQQRNNPSSHQKQGEPRVRQNSRSKRLLESKNSPPPPPLHPTYPTGLAARALRRQRCPVGYTSCQRAGRPLTWPWPPSCPSLVGCPSWSTCPAQWWPFAYMDEGEHMLL